MDKYLSVTEYASLHNKDVGNVRRLLLNGRLEGIKIGKQWAIKSDTPYPKDSRVKNKQYISIRKINRLSIEKAIINQLRELVNHLVFLYKDNLKAIYLYGSYARGEQEDDSDIDIALLIYKSDKAIRNNMALMVSRYELLIGKVISAFEIEIDKFNKWKDTMPFYRNLRKEGIILWKK